MRAIASAVLVMLAAFASAQAQVLYKWTDAQGKTQYSDKPPKGFTGPVTRIEPDEKATPSRPAAAARKPAPTPVAGRDEAQAPQDINTRRRLARERLTADVDRARAKLEAARKALAEGAEPGVEERQVIQQNVPRRTGGNAQPLPVMNTDPTQSAGAGGGMHGMTARSNCREAKGADGKARVLCPTIIPKPEYFERVNALEEAVKRAEEELSAAEGAYRRGTD